MVRVVAQGQEELVNQIQPVIHAQEEEHQGPMGQEEEPQQEEHHHQEEVIQEVMPAAAHLHGRRHHSSQEEQVVQEAHRQPLQACLIPGDILIHGLRWIDPGKLYRSSHCPPTIRVAAYWTCSKF